MSTDADLTIVFAGETLGDSFERLNRVKRAALDLLMHAKPIIGGGGVADQEWWDALSDSLSSKARYGEIKCAVYTPNGRCLSPRGHTEGHTA